MVRIASGAGVLMSQVNESKSSSSPASTKGVAAEPGAREKDKNAPLRGMGFDEAEQALSPNAPGERGGGNKVAQAIAYNQKAHWARGHVGPLQALLKTPASGQWDAPTVEGVMAFQNKQGLDDDGQVGPQTTKALKTELDGGTAAAAKSGDDKPTPAEPAKAPLPAAGKGAPAPSAAAAPPTTSVSASGPLKPTQVVVAQNQYRQNPFAPEWVGQLQAALDAPVSYVMDAATIQKVAEFQAEKGLKVTGFLRTDTLPPLLEKFPVLAEAKGTEHKREAKGAKLDISSSGDPIEDKAVRECKLGTGMNDYVSKFQKGTFLGGSVTGRPEFLARLDAAKRYLELKIGKPDAAVGKQLGSSVSNSYRPSSPSSPQAYHGIGQALDIDSSRNPWVVGNPQAKTANEGTTSIIRHASTLMGHGEGFDAATLHKWAQSMPTEELFEKLESSNTALREYRQIANDPAAIKAQFDARMAGPKPLVGKEAKLEYWLGKVPLHHKMLMAEKSNWHAHDENLGFMDQSKELVVALRDVAGLRWGATDMGESQSSDMMHWDNHNDGDAHRLWARVKDLRAAEKPPKEKS
ncbi:MAG: peptidoglycan-binding domain-containing protein [Myxococcota bacterium]